MTAKNLSKAEYQRLITQEAGYVQNTFNIVYDPYDDEPPTHSKRILLVDSSLKLAHLQIQNVLAHEDLTSLERKRLNALEKQVREAHRAALYLWHEAAVKEREDGEGAGL